MIVAAEHPWSVRPHSAICLEFGARSGYGRIVHMLGERLEDVYDRVQQLTRGRGADAFLSLSLSLCIDAVGSEPETHATAGSLLDRVEVANFMGTDCPDALRQAIHGCRNFGTASIVGVSGSFPDKLPIGSAMSRGVTFRLARIRVQRYLPSLVERIQRGEIDPSFVITHRAPLKQGPERHKTFRDKEQGCIKVVLKP